MKRRRKQPVDPQLLAYWRERSALLHEQLQAAPAASDAWFWQLQCDIIDYLLKRYGDGQPASEHELAAISAALDFAQSPRPTQPETSPSASITAHHEPGAWPRNSQKIRPILNSISQGNADRHDQLRLVHEQQLEELRLDSERRKISIVELRRIRKYLQSLDDAEAPIEEGTLSDKEAVDILTGKVPVEPLPENWGQDPH
jgi:hypothetical protein